MISGQNVLRFHFRLWMIKKWNSFAKKIISIIGLGEKYSNPISRLFALTFQVSNFRSCEDFQSESSFKNFGRNVAGLKSFGRSQPNWFVAQRQRCKHDWQTNQDINSKLNQLKDLKLHKVSYFIEWNVKRGEYLVF